MDLISVVMATYVEPIAWVKQSVDSILAQTYSNIQFVIVVDNPKNTQLIDVLKKYSIHDKRIELIINKENNGLVYSLNTALKKCRGKYIVRMDADDISLPNRISLQKEYLEKNNLDILGGGYHYFFENQIFQIDYNPKSHKSCKKILKYRNCMAHPTWFLKREVYEFLGGYRNIDACEDYDFLVRAVLDGFHIGNINEVVLKYRNNPNSISHLKNYKQKAIMGIVSHYYRKEKIITQTQYDLYINTSMSQDVERIRHVEEISWEIKQANSAVGRFVKLLFYCVTDLFFLKEKFINLRIKIIRKMDGLFSKIEGLHCS